MTLAKLLRNTEAQVCLEDRRLVWDLGGWQVYQREHGLIYQGPDLAEAINVLETGKELKEWKKSKWQT